MHARRRRGPVGTREGAPLFLNFPPRNDRTRRLFFHIRGFSELVNGGGKRLSPLRLPSVAARRGSGASEEVDSSGDFTWTEVKT